MSRGIVGSFETWKIGIGYPCMTGDIASTAGLTVHAPDDGVVHFAHWRPFDQNAVSRSADPSPARENPALRTRHQRARTMGSVEGIAFDTIARSSASSESLVETPE
jgi:hypothetical protein